MGSATISVDEFQALEAKVLQAVELIRKERDARAAAETELATAKAELAAAQSEALAAQSQLTAATSELNTTRTEAELLRAKLNNASSAQTEIENLHREREAVRLRVEKMLSQMDELL